ncbi:nitrogen regulation protein NR [Aliiglaciecola lipolytica E3]|uniref:Sensory histidine kinase/phosphatase NtrB n=1 Tax=Aliiglaciecola lipolytica E3 TaxID=1127673 RepID=K6YEH3_9ALTE|nr:nitrogen regulation protein NR(II) [Aliiglaciecola lipolytica]GAC15038.1 nitrogen regulation protein NR [Aliiglaciecola lipolytica E3]
MSEQFKYLLESLATAVLVLDENLSIRYANLAAQSLLELSENQLLGCPLTQFVSHSSVTFARLEKAFDRDQGFSDGEVLFAFADGRHVLTDVTVTTFDFEEKSALMVEIKVIDQQKRISQESQQWAQLQAARELIRGLAHEIKNPLGGVRGAAQLLEKELHSPDLKEFTQVIIEQSDRLRNLVDRLLGPNSLPNFEWVNIHKVLEKIRTLVKLDATHNIVIERDYDPSIPDLYLDQDMLQQAVLNIVTNSIQALDGSETPGEITIRSRIKRRFTIHGVKYPLVAQVKIIDNGPGIPVELKDTLFYPMVTGKSNGTGLGLSIAQSLVDHHKGKIDVESWPGHTAFKIYLPIEKKDVVQ